MKKIIYSIGIFIALASSSVFANNIYCPEYTTCVNSGKDCYLSTVGSPWKIDEGNVGRDGNYKFAAAGADANGQMTYCMYHVPPVVPGGEIRNIFFMAYGHNYVAALNQIGNNWTTSSINHGCRENGRGASSCPFASLPIPPK